MRTLFWHCFLRRQQRAKVHQSIQKYRGTGAINQSDSDVCRLDRTPRSIVSRARYNFTLSQFAKVSPSVSPIVREREIPLYIFTYEGDDDDLLDRAEKSEYHPSNNGRVGARHDRLR